MIATLGGINWLSQEGKFGLLIVVKKVAIAYVLVKFLL